jgi:hypothetical protein
VVAPPAHRALAPAGPLLALRLAGSLQRGVPAMTPQLPRQGISPLDDALVRVASKLTTLNDIQVRNGLPALALQDPRDIAALMAHQAQVVADFAARGWSCESVTEACAAQCVALLMALARVQELDVAAGDEAA